MTSREYWQQREEAQRKQNITDEAVYQKELSRIYSDMLDNIQKEIDSFYAKYAGKEGITLAEAKRRVAQLDIDAYARKAERYVREKNFSDRANEEMRLYNLTMKVNRLELLKANLGLELVGGFDELQRYFEQTLTDSTLAEFQRQAGILGESIPNPAQAAQAIVNASFHSATFSDRIWMYQDLLRGELDKQLQRGLIQGKGSRELARDLRKRFDVSRSDAERLITTELRRVQTEAAKQSYERNGNEEYEFLAVNPKGPCPICKALDGKRFPVKDLMPGKNAPPMHPRCHCATAPYWDEEEFQRWLEEENRKLHERMQDVTTGENRGIMNLRQTGLQNYPVTQQAIDGVPRIKTSGWTDAMADALQAAHRALLEYVRDAPVGTEAGFVCDLDGTVLDRRMGSQGGVRFPDLEMEHMLLHNHPDGLTFSETDLVAFLRRPESKVLTAVGNQGSVYLIAKTEHYQGAEFAKALVRELDVLHQTQTPQDYAEEMNRFLKEAEKYGVQFITRG